MLLTLHYRINQKYNTCHVSSVQNGEYLLFSVYIFPPWPVCIELNNTTELNGWTNKTMVSAFMLLLTIFSMFDSTVIYITNFILCILVYK